MPAARSQGPLPEGRCWPDPQLHRCGCTVRGATRSRDPVAHVERSARGSGRTGGHGAAETGDYWVATRAPALREGEGRKMRLPLSPRTSVPVVSARITSRWVLVRSFVF